MPSNLATEEPYGGGAAPSNTALLFAIAAAFALVHVFTNGRYGFHRDELQFLSDARHLDWGFVPYPPLTPFLERISLSIFGLSLIGLRLFSVVAQAIVIFATGLITREFGGQRLAQVAAAAAVGFSALPIFEATEFQYTSFDMLWWVLIAYCTVRLLRTDNPRWWIAIGVFVGLGLMTKYSIVFYIAGILCGVAFSRARRYVVTPWFWAGIVIALLIFLPNFIWLMRHQFISYDFLQHIHARDVGEGRADGYIKGQFLANANIFAAPLWIAGLIAFALNPRYRMLAWMYIVPVVIFGISKGRFYYVCAVYPMVIAMGAAVAERWIAKRPRWRQITLETVYFTGIILVGSYTFARLVPLASSGPLRAFALDNSGDLREEIGWDQLVRTVAQIRDSLPPEQRAHLGITTGNYGEYGAIEIFGPAYQLPAPIGTTNSEWLRGYPSPAPTTIIALGIGADEANRLFTNCRLAGHDGNSEGIRNEERLYHPDIFVCGPVRTSWPQVWKEHQDFG